MKMLKIFNIVMIAIIGFMATIIILSFLYNQPPPPSYRRALIIDTVGTRFPNKDLINYTKTLLESYGYKVDVVHGRDATVEFFRNNLTKYEVIIMRVHSTILRVSFQLLPNGTVGIITGERYNQSKYVSEQLNEMLIPSNLFVEVGAGAGYFTITPLFIRALKGNFNNTVIIVMGCHSLYTESMADAFIEKGAKAYIGWSDYVTVDFMDQALKKLIQYLFEKRMSIDEAVKSVWRELGVDPAYLAKLDYYPKGAGSYIIPGKKK